MAKIPKSYAGPELHCAFDKMIPVGKLIPNPRNPNTHPEAQIKLLAQIILAQGWRAPITVSNRSGFIVRGHGRLLAAQANNLEIVPVDFQDYESEAEEWADLIADNKIAELAEVDEDLLGDLLGEMDADMQALTGMMDDELDRLMEGEPGDGNTGDDVVPDVPEEPVSKLGDLYILGSHRLFCGDATSAEDVARLMDGDKADMVFTDPPYNINYGNIDHPKFRVRSIKNDNMSQDEFKTFCEEFSKRLSDHVDGCIYVCSHPGPYGRLLFSILDEYFHCSTTIIWNKDHFTLGRGKYQNKYEPIWFGWKKTGDKFFKDRKQTNVWDFPRPKASDLHPTMKPIELICNALAHASKKNYIVMDLFGGSGSTLIACEKTGRHCRMMELDEIYCDVILSRWSGFTGKDPIRLDDGKKFSEIQKAAPNG